MNVFIWVWLNMGFCPTLNFWGTWDKPVDLATPIILIDQSFIFPAISIIFMMNSVTFIEISGTFGIIHIHQYSPHIWGIFGVIRGKEFQNKPHLPAMAATMAPVPSWRRSRPTSGCWSRQSPPRGSLGRCSFLSQTRFIKQNDSHPKKYTS